MDNNQLPNVFLHDSKNDEIYISDNFFVLYKGGKLFYYKKIKEKLDIDDLKVFIKNTFGMNDMKIVSIKDVKIKKQNKIDYNFIKVVKKPYFAYYVLYLIALILIFLFLYVNTNNSDSKGNFVNLQTNIEKIKKDNKFTYITKKILEIYKNAKLNKVSVNSILFENSKVILILEAIEKDGIYKLLNKIEKSSIEDMQYNEEQKRYKAHVSFKISRN